MRILLAEDDNEYRDVLSETLQLLGHQVVGARDGVEAFRLLKSQPIDLIISDIQMPKRSGSQFHEMVRGDEQLKHIPFIYVTGYAILRIATPLDITGLDFMVSKIPFDRLLQLVGDIGVHRGLQEEGGLVFGAA